ncbi:Chondroadherin [Pseudolycoriella hygida]|uniref:Chondroadherin n=1 Tax=Pseudolycoriella hygida TaxID=35572 RepID=A0A9Q0S8A3_9DIPT|nr:Chondroadherin [Pseudolycoriella hygida]
MRKLEFLIIAVACGLTFSQNIILTCNFGDYGIDDLYMCSLGRITVLDSSVNVTFNGTHDSNKTDAHVDLVEIWSSNTPFIISQLFSTFPNLRFLNIYDSNLATIVIPPVAQLIQLVVQGNNVTTITRNSFRNQTQLRYLYVTHSGVTDIDNDAFEDLRGVQYFSLWNNSITKLAPRTLAPLVNVLRLSFRNNSLSTIDEDTFLGNTNLQHLEFGGNQINQIHPRAFVNLRNLTAIDLTANRCVEQSFELKSDQDWNAMNDSLALCFRNSQPVKRSITLEFSGPMTIYDELGNIIAQI